MINLKELLNEIKPLLLLTSLVLGLTFAYLKHAETFFKTCPFAFDPSKPPEDIYK